MAKYDVYPAPGGKGYVIDVQADLLDGLNTRVVVPVLPLAQAPQPADRLNPVFSINGESHVMATQYLAAVPMSVLGKPVANLADRFDEITNALDMVFVGF